MTEAFVSSLCGVCGVQPGDHVLAAVSGGADSVALLCLLCEARDLLHLTVSCAHVEHGIRGESARADMAFVEALCARMAVPLYTSSVDAPAYAREQGCGIEDAARTLRYAYLDKTAQRIGAQHIALAHHAYDQAETVLMHAARGSDLRGVCAMRFRRGRLIRPLLHVMPDALRDYLRANGQTWREDETNDDQAYARNQIRHFVMPALLDVYPGAVQALCRLAQAAQRDEAHFDEALCALDVPVYPLVSGAAVSCEALRTLDEALLGRFLLQMMRAHGFDGAQTEDVRHMAQAIACGTCERINLLQGAHADVSKQLLCITRSRGEAEDTPLALLGETQTPFGSFLVREAREGEWGDGVTAQAFDAQQLLGASVTGRREGDTIVPFGRKTAVKLKKLYIDAGVFRPLRDSMPVIRRGETILWAAGLRPSALCAGQPGARRLLVIWNAPWPVGSWTRKAQKKQNQAPEQDMNKKKQSGVDDDGREQSDVR